MPLLSLREVTFGHGGQPLIEHVDLRIERGERIALLGRNGVGKSTLLKLLNGELHADDGELTRQPGLRTARLVQEVPPGTSATIGEIVAGGAPEHLHEADTHWRIEEQVNRLTAMMDLD